MTQLLPYLAHVCREARKDAGVGPAKVAGEAGYAASTSISRTFEGADAWPQNPDNVVGAYAKATGVSVFDLWDEAVKRAREASERAEGAPDPHALERAAREGRHADQQRRAEGDRAKQKKTAGG
jgi:hypothetical protein